MATVPVQEVVPVRSRVSFGAVISGALVSLAVYLLLSVLGVALGLSVSGQATNAQLGTAAAVWAVCSLLVALFCGGFIVSQCTVGETAGEAAIYGVVMWGLFFAILVWMTAAGARIGFNTMMSIAGTEAAAPTRTVLSDADLERAGFSKSVIESNREYFNHLGENVGAQMRATAEEPQAVPAAWWTFAGVLFSMLAALIGAVCGSGPSVEIGGYTVRSRFVPLRRQRGVTT